jgi:hypothetical protein
VTSPATTGPISHRLYRTEALERLMAPEQLDQPLSLARPKGWVIVLALALLVSFAGLWGVLGSVKDTATAQGTVVRTTTQPRASFDLALRLPRREAAGIHGGMAVRVVPLSGGATSVPWRGIVQWVSAVAPSDSSPRGKAEGQLRVHLDATTPQGADSLSRDRRYRVTIITGTHTPFQALIR